MTLESGRWSWTTPKSGSARLALTGIRRTSEVALFATQLGWLMTRRAGHWSWTTPKSGSARLALTDVRRAGKAACFQPHSQIGLRPEELGTGAGQ
ncbi:hypothetical protein [uncultured Planococcus sp.]|uniref:hypothetical protein n=1 Tax=uncultured Planococcus sp. TaxID=337815 RepID=UPI00263106B7|nr:hypothetical protein [uncultured Planococcus sp.]